MNNSDNSQDMNKPKTYPPENIAPAITKPKLLSDSGSCNHGAPFVAPIVAPFDATGGHEKEPNG